MTCARGCVHGYVNTDEVRVAPGQPLTEGRISLHLEFCTRMNLKTRIKLCKCQTHPDPRDEHEAAEVARRWRLEW